MFRRLRVVCVVLFVMFLFAMPICAASTNSGSCGVGVTWSLNDSGTLTIQGSGAMTNYLPDADSGFSTAPWHASMAKIRSIVIENGVTHVGNFAFLNASSLQTVSFPDSLSSIGESAFGGCSGLSSVQFPQSLSKLHDRAFEATGLQKATFSGNAPTCGTDVFTSVSSAFCIYYSTNTSGWNQGTWANYTLIPTDTPTQPTDPTIPTTPTTPTVGSVSFTASSTFVTGGESFSVTLQAPSFHSTEFTLTYDASLFTYTGIRSNISSVPSTNTSTTGTLVVADFGAEKNSYTISFVAKETTSTRSGSIQLTSAAFGTSKDAATKDLQAVTTLPTPVTVYIEPAEVDVSFSSSCAGYFTGNTSVLMGNDYTFAVQGDGIYYNYTFSITMGGSSVTPIDNGNHTYTVKNVTAKLVIHATRTAKTFGVNIVDSTGKTLSTKTATYGTSFVLTLAEFEDAQKFVSAAVAKYKTNTATLSYTNIEGKLTIQGTSLIDDITITLTLTDKRAAVSIEGSGSGDVKNYVTNPEAGKDYTLTIVQDTRYDYAVVAKVNDVSVTVTKNDNQYTIAGASIPVSCKIVFTVDKSVNVDHFTVNKYLSVKGTTLYRIVNAVPKMETDIYKYNGTAMYWSEKYNGYCTLVTATSDPNLPKASEVEIVPGTVVGITYDYNVNKSSRVDANDAQLVYDMYKQVYSGFTDTVTMENYLRADVNADGIVSVADAAMIIDSILRG